MQVRQELASVQYASNVLGARGPRKMEVCVPAIKNNRREVFRPFKKSEGLTARAKAHDYAKCFFLINKPVWKCNKLV